METTALSWIILLLLGHTSTQYLGTNTSRQGICLNFYGNSIETLPSLKDCTVVVGNLRVKLFETYASLHFPNLREVTGFVVVYQLNELESVGKLFPNLARIRGQELLYDYALIVNTMKKLKEVGLYNLIQIDRGGVEIWAGPRTCYVNTVNWSAIAPESKLTLVSGEMNTQCSAIENCNCGNSTNNYCWNSKHCQRFFKDGDCHPECLGCFDGERDKCLVCRHYTNNGYCVSECPRDTIILQNSKYCVTVEECNELNGWSWKGDCVLECPVGFSKTFDSETQMTSCEPNPFNRKVCEDQNIHSINRTQMAEKCTYINGSLEIYIRTYPKLMKELNKYMGRIEEVRDYVIIHGSEGIDSLHFLSSLRRIRGHKLKDGIYSLVIYNMRNLKAIFTPNVTQSLQIDRGKLQMYRNPKLCMSKVDEIRGHFPEPFNEADIPVGMNGYSGGCFESDLKLSVRSVTESSATLSFYQLFEQNVNYTIFYMRLPTNYNKTVDPECCNEARWFTTRINLGLRWRRREKVELKYLRPASTYVVCVEIGINHNNGSQYFLARSVMKNFTTRFLKPAPPFVIRLEAKSSEKVFVEWIDHKRYKNYITHHQLDIRLIEIPSKDLRARNHCAEPFVYNQTFAEQKYTRPHKVMLKPPKEYTECGDCEIASLATEDFFDVCSALGSACDYYEEPPPANNTKFGKYVNTLVLEINGSKNNIEINGLAPFRDYRIRLRACAGQKCSRSTRNVFRTLRAENADVPTITNYHVNKMGHVSIKWEPPDITNGPVLAYYVQILPVFGKDNKTIYLPHLFCVPENVFVIDVKFAACQEFRVRLCSSTLGSALACGDWMNISISILELHFEILSSIIFSITLVIVPLIVGKYYRRRKITSDGVPLVDMYSTYENETEPPSAMLVHSVPLYTVPLRDSLIEY